MDKDETYLERIMAFKTLSFWAALLHYKVWNSCNYLLPQFQMDSFQTLYTCWGALQMCIRLFDTDVVDFDRITVFCNL